MTFGRARSDGRLPYPAMLLLLFEQWQVLAVAFFLQFFYRDKPKRGRIDAVTLVSRPRTIIKDVAEMGIALAGTDLGPLHPKSAIRFLGDVLLFDRFGETRPATSAVEFIERREKRFAAHDVDINSSAMIVPIFVVKRRFRSAHLRDA